MVTNDLDAAVYALASATRREILDLVRRAELSAGEIARHFPISRPAVSHHLKVLRETGLVRERKDGARRFFLLDVHRLEAVLGALAEGGDLEA
jgi:DNA-binding transcriptional ArsR family regulator